jgi:hypothetical protein
VPEKRRISTFLLLFLALLWLGATFAYFGHTGKHSDDYWTTLWSIDGQRLNWKHQNPWRSWPYFWRPLHLIHIWFNNTVFWKMDWVPHLELALVHGLVCVLLYRLLLRLGSARGPALCGAILFGTFPLLAEAVLWSSASCNAIGAALMLWALLLVFRMASRERPTAGMFAGIMALSFAAACFYEPAGAGLAIAPIVAWAAARGAPARAKFVRASWATLAAGLPCMLYAVLLAVTAPKGNRGASSNMVHPAELPEVAAKFLHEVRYLLWGIRGKELLFGCLEQGWMVVRHRIVIGAMVAGTTIAGLLALARWARGAWRREPSAEDRALGSGSLLPLLGLALFYVAFLPFIASGQKGVELRSIYIPMLGIAFIVAGVGNALRRATLRLEPPVRTGLGALGLGIVGALAIFGQVGLIGFQSQFRNNARMDVRVSQQFTELGPRVESQTVFMIILAEHHGAATSHRLYNDSIHTALAAPWSATTFVRRAMKRNDVHLISSMFWDPWELPIEKLTPESLYRHPRGLIDPELIGWDRIVPIWVDGAANVHIVTSLTVKPLGQEMFTVNPPRAARLLAGGGLGVNAGTTFGLEEIRPGIIRLVTDGPR